DFKVFLIAVMRQSGNIVISPACVSLPAQADISQILFRVNSCAVYADRSCERFEGGTGNPCALESIAEGCVFCAAQLVASLVGHSHDEFVGIISGGADERKYFACLWIHGGRGA